VTFRYDKTLKDAAAPERVRWVIDRGMAKLCLVITFLAGFFIGAALVAVIATS
jgi:hypothetical protein